MDYHSATRWLTVVCAACVLGAGLAGCGGKTDTTKRFDVSGAVKCDGKAVPSGSIVFEPDPAKGNQGPAGFAQIADGKFDTAQGGKGTVGGAHVVRISGTDKTALFSDYVVHVDLPKDKTTKDFEVPAAAKAPASATPGPDYKGP